MDAAFGLDEMARVSKRALELFRRAGWKITLSERSYYPGMDDPELSAECRPTPI